MSKHTFLRYYQENGGWPQHCQDDHDGPVCSKHGKCVDSGFCQGELLEERKKAFQELPCNVPGYPISIGAYLMLIKKSFNQGNYSQVFEYLSLLDNEDRTLLSVLNKAAGYFE